MPEILPAAVRIPVPGGKLIEEHVGAAASATTELSVAHMHAPAGWSEPFQTPAFTEFSVVVHGMVTVECDGVTYECSAGQTIVTRAGERIRYGVGHEGAEYYAICLPAFTPDNVHREAE